MDNNAKKLLIIDDDPRLRELLLRYLTHVLERQLKSPEFLEQVRRQALSTSNF